MVDKLTRAVRRVVENDNCTGCGACALLSDRVSMDLDRSGFLRPSVSSGDGINASTAQDAAVFSAVCPGIRLDAPHIQSRKIHPVFGVYASAWQGWAADAEARHEGSSGGVLTALSTWFLARGKADAITASIGGVEDPKRTLPVRLTNSRDVLSAAGSRYAPVSNLLAFDPKNSKAVLVAKPCEVSAVSRLNRVFGISDDKSPVRLSFFCAGTPSQSGTNNLVEFLGIPAPQVSDVRYRGRGWPGEFVAEGDGKRVSMSYDESWGRHIGRDIQWRCKLCVDGTGADSDISVGDFWTADENGYPQFQDAEGNSVVIARTERGHKLLMEAANDGVVVLSPVDLDDVARIQPLQVDRKYLLLGRLLGRLVTGKKIPRYYGYGLFRLMLSKPKGNLRAVVGTARRSIRIPGGGAK